MTNTDATPEVRVEDTMELFSSVSAILEPTDEFTVVGIHGTDVRVTLPSPAVPREDARAQVIRLLADHGRTRILNRHATITVKPEFTVPS